MINNKEEQKINKNEDQKINDKNADNNLIKKNLIEYLEVQLKESEEKILEKKIESEKELIKVSDRLNKEIEKTKKFSLEKIIINFLPIVDNIERALNLIEKNQSNEIFIKILNTLNNINDSLKKSWSIFNIKKIDDTNVPFNPSIHQAMSIHYTNEIKPNQIVTVMQPGYILNDSRLLRPAMVVVSQKKQ